MTTTTPDFFCSELLLAIEIDGNIHNYQGERDRHRQERIESLGVRFLRFTERDVKQNMEGVLYAIETWIAENTPNLPAANGE